MKGLDNLGATCWLNALVQCLRVARNWDESCEKDVDDDSFTREFFRLVRGETDNTTDFLKELPVDPFGNNPSDSQEALLYILDRIEKIVTDFTGEVTQTVIYPGGRSVTKTPCTVWFPDDPKKKDVLSGYQDDSGKTHRVAVVERELTKVPEVLVSTLVQEELYGKPLIGIVCWGGGQFHGPRQFHGTGHYVAYVKEAGDWWYVNDHYIKKANPNIAGYIGFYGVGKTHTPRTHSQET